MLYIQIMFSTDQNVEKLADLMVLMKDYLRLQSNYLQLTATEKAIRIMYQRSPILVE